MSYTDNQGTQNQRTEYLEREIKLGADFDFDVPDLREVVGSTLRLPEQELRTRYFDTADFRLWQRGITLRHRTGENQASGGTWTVKLPAGSGDTLDRTELSWPGEPEVFPAEVTALVRGLVRRATLEQVAELSTIRRRLVLHDESGTSWGELDDDTVTVVSGRLGRLRFRQLELELGPADGTVIDGVLEALRRAGARADGESKLAKALGLPSPGDSGSEMPEVGKGASTGDVVRSSLAQQLDRLLERDYRLRVNPGQPVPEDVHQARVATRRLRSDLKLLTPVLDPIWVGHTRTELKWLAEALGRVRDLDVLDRALFGAGKGPETDSGGWDELHASLQAQRRAASEQLAQAMGDDRYLNLLDRLHAGTVRPPFHPGPSESSSRRISAERPAAKVLPSLVQERRRTLHKKVVRAGRRPSDVELHRIRIRAKQVRYAAETAASVLGKPMKRLATSAEAVQTVLGEHHDSVTAEAWLRAQVGSTSQSASFAAGLLTAQERRRQRQLRREWRSLWKKLARS